MAAAPKKAAQTAQVYTNDGGSADHIVRQGTDVAVPAAPTNTRTVTGATKVMITTEAGGALNQSYVNTAYSTTLSRGGPQTPNLNP